MGNSKGKYNNTKREHCANGGFGLVMILIIVAMIALFAGAYYSQRVKKVQETKRQMQQQAQQLELQVDKQIKEFESKLPENINDSANK